MEKLFSHVPHWVYSKEMLCCPYQNSEQNFAPSFTKHFFYPYFSSSLHHKDAERRLVESLIDMCFFPDIEAKKKQEVILSGWFTSKMAITCEL